MDCDGHPSLGLCYKLYGVKKVRRHFLDTSERKRFLQQFLGVCARTCCKLWSLKNTQLLSRSYSIGGKAFYCILGQPWRMSGAGGGGGGGGGVAIHVHFLPAHHDYRMATFKMHTSKSLY